MFLTRPPGRVRKIDLAMKIVRPLLALCSLLLAFAPDVRAAPGDVYVPAHRTRDGHYVPPNVPPSSAGTRASRRAEPGTAAQRQANVEARAAAAGRSARSAALTRAAARVRARGASLVGWIHARGDAA